MTFVVFSIRKDGAVNSHQVVVSEEKEQKTECKWAQDEKPSASFAKK
jgi:hypothetical protein